MNLPPTVPFALLGTTFAFAVVELGLTGYIVSLFTQGYTGYLYDPWTNGYTSQTVRIVVSPILAFILFNSIWTMLVSVATAVIPWVFRSKATVGTGLNKLITIGLLGLYFVTMVFWLASFATVAARLSYGAGESDYVNVIIAFAVLIWLLFCTLTIVVVLGICGVFQCDLPGYRPLGKQDSPAPAPQNTQMDEVAT
ncbi:hypothetical protein BDV38DRAFT_57775 [Aspergillus pseudotamarii]|uniref:MARVEL domain-containing protein n=1 Tax=Aspergillus pseudotamarii TaxID=132259 RepID=A0A5N6SWF9_ASPPS|nr:uncharacterized protein BDV38DRAFT_57775 [Aspergillus pseudotamarii]KAE8139005.1 hypothetical protein BDV38DRAFT_57775 [Aspergillus pseudotamarii]